MLKKAAFVDFDGVIVKNKSVLSKVQKRAVSYVQHKLKSSDSNVCERVNEHMYKTSGHTLIGLCDIVGEQHAGTLQEFNSHVYGDLHLDKDEFYEIKNNNMSEWKAFVAQMKFQGIPIYIFSNAPEDWCLTFIDAEDISGIYSPSQMSHRYLKPLPAMYDLISEKHGSSQIYFIDDNDCNLRRHHNWTNIHYNSKMTFKWLMRGDNAFVARDMMACAEIITSTHLKQK